MWRDGRLTKSVTPRSAWATRRRAETLSGGCPLSNNVWAKRIPYWGFKGARVATREDWASVVQQNKQPRSDEHQTKRHKIAVIGNVVGLQMPITLQIRGTKAKWIGAQELSVDAVCARVAKKILPFEREEPQANLQKVEIFFKPLACPCTHVLWTKWAIDEHLFARIWN